jgi:hypothetical protein
MKTLPVVLSFLTLLTVSAFAGSEALVRDRAKAMATENNNREAAARAANAPAQPTPQIQAPPPALQLTATQRLQIAMGAIKTNSTVTAAQKAEITRDLTGTITGSNKHSPASISKLADDLSAALAEKSLTKPQQARLVQDIITLFNGAGLSPTRRQSILDDAQSLLGNGSSRATAVMNDLKTIAGITPEPAAK